MRHYLVAVIWSLLMLAVGYGMASKPDPTPLDIVVLLSHEEACLEQGGTPLCSPNLGVTKHRR